MAGTTRTVKRAWSNAIVSEAAAEDALKTLVEEQNKVIDDLATVNVVSSPALFFQYQVEDLGAGVDITERAFFSSGFALEIQEVVAIFGEATVGVDGSNTLLITLRNITQAEDVASVTLTANQAAGARTTVSITNDKPAANDVLGLIVTQGTTADAGLFELQAQYARFPISTPGTLVAAKLQTIEAGTP